MHHFFLPPESFSGNMVQFPREISHQILHVLRLLDGALVCTLDGSGRQFLTRLEISGKEIRGEIVETSQNQAEPQVRLSLAVSLTAREKFEWILQKGTELGVSAFYPFFSSHSLIQGRSQERGKQERWERIIREAAEQCERGRLPVLQSPLPFKECMQSLVQLGPVYIALERSGKTALSPMAGRRIQDKNIALVVGPEGGFSPEEASFAIESGAAALGLGPRILRMETAAIAGSTLLLAAAGELGISAS